MRVGQGAFALLLALAIPVLADEAKQDVRVKSEAVNVRQKPATTAPVLFAAKAGDTFHYVGTEGDWVQVETKDGKRGFVFKSLVELIPAASAAAQPAPAVSPVQTAKLQGAPTIDHKPLECILADHFPKVDAGFSGGDMARTRVYFRADGTLHWYYVDMSPEKDRYAAVLPKPKKETQKIDYYVDGLTKESVDGRTQDYTPAVVTSKSQCQKMTMAATSSAAKLVVGAEPGAPPIPEGFDPAGILQAAGATAAGTVAATAGSHTVLFIAGGAVAVGGIAIAAKGGGSSTPTPPPCVPSGFDFHINYGFQGSVSCSASNTVDQTYTITNNTCASLTVQDLSLAISFSGSSQCVNNPNNVPETLPLILNGTTIIPAGQTATIRTSPVGVGQARTFCCPSRGCPPSTCTVDQAYTVKTTAGSKTLSNPVTVSGGNCPACSLPHADATTALCYAGGDSH